MNLLSRSGSVLRLWLLALALSAALAAAGQRWPDPLPIRPGVVWTLLLLPVVLLALQLFRGWALPEPDVSQALQPGDSSAAAQGGSIQGVSPQGGESDDSDRESN